MVLVEALSCGTPALVSKIGSMEEIITDCVNGLHFEMGDASDLSKKVQWLIDNPEDTIQMGLNARSDYLENYLPENNYETLMNIYNKAISEIR